MLTSLFSAALLALSTQAAQPAPAQPAATQISQENAALLRCSAAFALISFGQANGDEAAQAWPPVDPRGREFFVRSLAKIIDETGMTREEVAQLAQMEAQRLIDEELIDSVMPGCLLLLESSQV